MPRALSIQEFDYKSLEERLRHVEAFLDRSVPVRVRSECAKGRVRSLAALRGKTAILPSLEDTLCHWEPDVSRGLLSRVDWLERNQESIRASPLDFFIKLLVQDGVSISAGDFWFNGGFRWSVVVEAPTRDFGSFGVLRKLVEERVASAGIEIENIFSGVRRYRLAFPCTFVDFRVIARYLEEKGFDAPDDVHWLLNGRKSRDVIQGANPQEVAEKFSSVFADRCQLRHQYALGVVFDLAIALGANLVCPPGWWTYEAVFDDGNEVAKCGVDRSETVLFDQPEARTIGVISTSFGAIQLNRIYADGKYCFELESKYSLDELPKELVDWGVEFDLK